MPIVIAGRPIWAK